MLLLVCLVYYPGHLATAVCFESEVKGDYLTLSGRRFVVCDPTYIGAPVGRTMPGMNNARAKVVVLEEERDDYRKHSSLKIVENFCAPRTVRWLGS